MSGGIHYSAALIARFTLPGEDRFRDAEKILDRIDAARRRESARRGAATRARNRARAK